MTPLADPMDVWPSKLLFHWLYKTTVETYIDPRYKFLTPMSVGRGQYPHKAASRYVSIPGAQEIHRYLIRFRKRL